ncbi:hypothetical protein GcM3_063018 [Golovinomyces cichoracearum]|uniref:Secreted effector protein n=1 Tax=Golovinomyces cichoracearum TaxID=62708 RepID=A0A420IVE3_9PEZI|nr:hypothetical protein GcM3_063018 [Golovinomyces cichoracearum]
MRITCYATTFSILYALVCGTKTESMSGRRQPHITLNKISKDVVCLEDLRLSRNDMNISGKSGCLKVLANKQQKQANEKFNIPLPSIVVRNYKGTNFQNQPDGSILFECHSKNPKFSIRNHWYAVAAWNQETKTCTVLGAEMIKRTGEPQVCVTANGPRKSYKFHERNYRTLPRFEQK